MTERLASCSCGQLTLAVRGEPMRVSMCHCLACQRRSGSTYAVQARFASADVTIAGESTVYVRVSDEGNAAHFHFCPRCGATVFYRFADDPSVTAVPVGAFADPAFPARVISWYGERRHAWVSTPPDAEHG